MRFLSTILLLVSVVLVICVPYFVGHGLAIESSGWILAGVVCGVLAAGMIFATIKAWPRDTAATSSGHDHPHA